MFSDPILLQLVEKYPAPKFEDRSAKLFTELLESIVSQQLSIKAADTIYARFLNLFSDEKPLTPENLLAIDVEALRGIGISYQKASYLHSIADAFISDLIDIDEIKNMSDTEVISSLTQIRGVGRWTAEMILIFTLNRPDVFSIGDLGLRNAITRLYGITDQKKMLELSETWAPHRSTASWYLWRSLENKA